MPRSRSRSWPCERSRSSLLSARAPLRLLGQSFDFLQAFCVLREFELLLLEALLEILRFASRRV